MGLKEIVAGVDRISTKWIIYGPELILEQAKGDVVFVIAIPDREIGGPASQEIPTFSDDTQLKHFLASNLLSGRSGVIYAGVKKEIAERLIDDKPGLHDDSVRNYNAYNRQLMIHANKSFLSRFDDRGEDYLFG